MGIEQQIEEQRAICERALAIYRDREPVRGSIWRDFPAQDKVREIRERCARMDAAFARLDAFRLEGKTGESVRVAATDARRILTVLIEDAVDCINFVGFLVRQIEDEYGVILDV